MEVTGYVRSNTGSSTEVMLYGSSGQNELLIITERSLLQEQPGTPRGCDCYLVP